MGACTQLGEGVCGAGWQGRAMNYVLMVVAAVPVRIFSVCGRQAGKRVGGLTDGWSSVQEKPFV